MTAIMGPLDVLGSVPDAPSRPDYVRIVGKKEKVKQGNRKAFAHRYTQTDTDSASSSQYPHSIRSVAHAESYAIDLMWDMICRFGPSNDMPRSFYDDFVRIALEESRHFTSWATRLLDFDSFYGDLPGHDGLWDSAADTADDVLARLALVHLVHEARGLDTYPMAVARFTKCRDDTTLTFMAKNHAEEVTHVEAGVRWFSYVCALKDQPVLPTFHRLVQTHYRGHLLPPFNTPARDRAGMTEAWYLPLTTETPFNDAQTQGLLQS
ncbi:hypothetical protein DYB28_004658 [Aphanomyces astaci]|uniref:DUF455 domain-containing protein n=1 Tax=Aphanomyces astaci TaxID=112090 RepID=A0A397DQN9_APHAT|nr:hypothetical protein DYB38_004170 [Aphanomyces astaci]RHY66346.1 hypothetical protein DYB30_008885 [Aphanomyces astaci]RHZ41290.1 hypothetical protein DYB26_006980 [Aphanomyces astaci]RLO09854.1 hypothetical protein DYB28_004658 [Aphanomyces astaci]